MKHLVLILLIAAGLVIAPSSRKKYSDFDETFKKYSKRFFGPEFDWKVFKAQGIAESGLNVKAVSWVGARGLMQIMPTTFKEIQSKNSEFKVVDDAEMNIGAGIYYDRQLYNAWKGSITDHRLPFVFGSYNAGRGTILKAQKKAVEHGLDKQEWNSITSIASSVKGWRYKETLDYVTKIKAFRDQL